MASADQISCRNLGRRSSRRPLRKAKSTTQASGAQRSVCASGGEGRVRIDAGTIKKGNSPPQLPRQRLAKRKARKEPLVKCRVLPDDLRVQHGAHGPEDSARPRPCSRRGRRVWGQESLEPHPVVGEGACARVPQRLAFFLSTAPPSLSFCRLQKDYARRRVPEATAALRRLLAGGKWGWKAPGLCPHPPVGQPSPNPRRKATKAPSRSAAPAA